MMYGKTYITFSSAACQHAKVTAHSEMKGWLVFTPQKQ